MDYISVCGFKCHDCAVYIATMENDDAARAELAKLYSSGGLDFSKEDVNCRGCHGENEVSHKFCGGCEMKKCATEKNIPNCGKCAEYPCELLCKYVPDDSENRKILDEIKASKSKNTPNEVIIGGL